MITEIKKPHVRSPKRNNGGKYVNPPAKDMTQCFKCGETIKLDEVKGHKCGIRGLNSSKSAEKPTKPAGRHSSLAPNKELAELRKKAKGLGVSNVNTKDTKQLLEAMQALEKDGAGKESTQTEQITAKPPAGDEMTTREKLFSECEALGIPTHHMNNVATLRKKLEEHAASQKE